MEFKLNQYGAYTDHERTFLIYKPNNHSSFWEVKTLANGEIIAHTRTLRQAKEFCNRWINY